jgi:osmotically-inducible protein OsmY
MFKIGADVYCTDGRAGRLIKVVMDPHTRRVTDLIVEKGFLQKVDRVIPVWAVEEADEERIQLRVSSRELEEFPRYREAEFRVPLPEWEADARYRLDEVIHWATRYGIPIEPVRPMIRQRVKEGVHPDQPVIGRGTRVYNVDGTVGHIDHLLVDRQTEEITHLVVRKGLFPRRLVIPMEWVKSVSDEGVYVHATREELSRLTQHVQRADADILMEIRDRLAAVEEFDLSRVVARIEDGFVRLSGQVKDVAAKRRAEAVVRSVEGVVGVENRITTDTGVRARVIAALLEDPRTGLFSIEVTSDHGVVTLSGAVGSDEARRVAEEIARRQRGVIDVINELRVEPDQWEELFPPHVPAVAQSAG